MIAIESIGTLMRATLAAGVLALVTGCAGDVAEVTESATVVPAGATNPTVAVSEDGRGYVAWVGDDDGQYNVYLASATAGATFSQPVRVNDVPGDAAPHEQAPAQVAVGPGGEIYVLWQNNTVIEGRRFPASDLRLAVSTDNGTTFRPAITVNDDAGEVPSSHTFHDLDVAPDGTVVVSWIDSREQDRAEIGMHEGHAGMAQHALQALGPEIRVARSTDAGASFSPSVVVDGDSCPCCRTSLAIGPDGTLYVAWRKIFPGDTRDIVVAAAAPGQEQFGDPVRVFNDGWVFPGCPHAGPSLAVDDEGRVHIGWYTGREDRQGLWYATSDDGARTFSTPVALLTGEWVPPSQVALTRADGEVWVSWEDRTVEPAVVHLGRIGAQTGTFESRTSMPAGRSPSLDGGGPAALVAWLEGESIRAHWTPPQVLAGR